MSLRWRLRAVGYAGVARSYLEVGCFVFFSVFADEYFITAGCLSKQRSSSSLQGEDEPHSSPRPPPPLTPQLLEFTQ